MDTLVYQVSFQAIDYEFYKERVLFTAANYTQALNKFRTYQQELEEQYKQFVATDEMPENSAIANCVVAMQIADGGKLLLCDYVIGKEYYDANVLKKVDLKTC